MALIDDPGFSIPADLGSAYSPGPFPTSPWTWSGTYGICLSGQVDYIAPAPPDGSPRFAFLQPMPGSPASITQMVDLGPGGLASYGMLIHPGAACSVVVTLGGLVLGGVDWPGAGDWLAVSWGPLPCPGAMGASASLEIAATTTAPGTCLLALASPALTIAPMGGTVARSARFVPRRPR